jgi:valyl-tRNA synthetase
MALAAKPDFKAIEAKWQKFWLDKKIFKFDKKSKNPIFSIDVPPPTVSGDLHIGHAVSYTHFDVMGYYMRQRGYNVLQPIGFDDNGHPTETFIEKTHKIASKNMDKVEFNNIVLKEIPKVEETYKKDLISLGYGYDWDLTYSTVSSDSMKLVQTSFLDLYNKGFTYRKEAPTIWCTKCQTALAQADLEDKEKETKLNYLNFKVDKSIIEIATTRPEFLPACVGIFVHPDDKKYKKFVGKEAEVPIFGQHVKIMTDEKVDPNFGTGAVMICTFGDKTDIEWWRKYKLPLRMMLTKDGKLNELAGKYAGQKIEEARKNILEELKEKNILKKQEPLKQTVSVCWRCPTPAEYIVTKQWFVKLLENKNKFKELGRKVQWHPAYFIKIYENWVENLSEDWLISRQRHFGPPIPVWYCKKCGKEILPDEKDLPVNPEKDKPAKKCSCGSKEYEPEHDVFDTWMTSSLTPQLVLGWNNKNIPKAFPMTLRPSGRDIIRTWEFYTIVKSWYHFKDLPWTNTLISGMVYDPFTKEVMHKSKGSAVAPKTVIEKYGSDAFRYWAVSSIIGEDLWYQERELQHAQKLLIKLWNVAKFVEMWKVKPKKFKPTNIIDSWIASRLSQVTKKFIETFDNYDPVTAKKDLENFFWHEYCDFYLEMIKYRLYGQDKEAKESAEQTLYSTFYKILKMFAPILVHETEEIYHELFKDKEASIHLTQMPEVEPVDMEATELGNIAVDIISEIRKYKASKGLGPGAEMEKLTVKHPDAKAEKVLDEVAKTCRIKHLHIEKGELSVA